MFLKTECVATLTGRLIRLLVSRGVMITGVLFGGISHAGETELWSVKYFKDDGTSVLELKGHENIRLILKTRVDGGAKILSTKANPCHPFITMIDYDGGTHGTSARVRITRTALFDTRHPQKFIGDEPSAYEDLDNKYQPAQPKWSCDKKTIKVEIDGQSEMISIEGASEEPKAPESKSKK